VRYLLLATAALGSTIGSACFGGGGQPTAVPPTQVASTAPSPAPTRPAAAASPLPAAKPTPTPEPELTMVWVGNTDGEGVYLRATPAMADRLRAYPDRTPLTIIDVDVEAEGMTWHHVRAPDGLEGYVPAMYTVTTEP
jgi:hypothetical protein